jgi:hypothetical protein
MIANAKRANASDEYVAVTSIPIADQITRELPPTTCRRQLVGDPFRPRTNLSTARNGIPIWLASTQHDYLLFEHQDFGFQR